MSQSNSLNAISPIDGRYLSKLKELGNIFSESALMRYRLKVEIEYLIALSKEEGINEVREFSEQEQLELRNIFETFSDEDAQRIKEIEKTTNHDVKSVEYFLKEKLQSNEAFQSVLEYVHFALTSEDVSNLSYTLMMKQGLHVYLRTLDEIVLELKILALKYKNVSLLSLTHGQPATPTTLGKEFAVHYWRLRKQMQGLYDSKFLGKLSGASGNWNAQYVAYPEVEWIDFSKQFVESLGLTFNPLVTQIESHDSLAKVYNNISRVNSIVRDLDQDMWLYISRGILRQKKVEGEIGSSTMPHKVNPIDFENSEGNTGLANSLLVYLADKLLVSRMQRDLTDSTIIRNQGVALGYSLLALKSTLKGLSKIDANLDVIEKELNDHWEVLAEPIQIVLRKLGYDKPYEALKNLTRGQEITQQMLHEFIRGLEISEEEKTKLLNLSPSNYIGLAPQVVDKYLQ